MKLVYKNNPQQEVAAGDTVNVNDTLYLIKHFAEPHKPNSEGKVTIQQPDKPHSEEVYVSVIGAQWIEREDRDLVEVRAAVEDSRLIDLEYLTRLWSTKTEMITALGLSVFITLINETAAHHFDPKLDAIKELDFLATLTYTKHRLKSNAAEETHNASN